MRLDNSISYTDYWALSKPKYGATVNSYNFLDDLFWKIIWFELFQIMDFGTFLKIVNFDLLSLNWTSYKIWVIQICSSLFWFERV